MPGTKRTFSTAFPGETPPKLTKKATSTRSRPSLKKDSTLPIVDPDEELASSSKAPSKRASSVTSLLKKSSSVSKGSLVSNLSGLKSGSIVGITSSPSVTALSKKASSVKSSVKGPSLPSGLTKLAMSKCGSKGSIRVSGYDLVEDIDETEMESALESLKSTLSKRGSKPSLSKSATGSKASLKKPASGSKASLAKSASVRSVADDAEAGSSAEDPAPLLPPGGLMEIAISFDTTGSMYGCLAEVRAKIQDLVQRLQADIPGIRIAIIAHGDYCDASNYIVKWIDFGATLPELCDFVKTVGRTGGGDGPECYELVLKRAREALSWTPGSKRALIMIGDDEPHPVGYKYGGKTYYINWRDECEALAEMGVTVYGVQSGTDAGSTRFNAGMAVLTGGKHLQLKDFGSMFDFIMMICYREANPDMIPVYAEEMKARKKRLADAEAVAIDFGKAAKGPMPFPGGIPPSAPAFGFGAVPFAGAFGGFGTVLSPFAGGKGKKARAGKPKPVKIPKTAKTAGKAPVKGVKAGKKGGKATKAVTGVQAKGAKAAKKRKEAKVESVLKREKVPDAKLSTGKLKGVTWTKWIKVMIPGSVPTVAKGKGKGTVKDPRYIACKNYKNPTYRLRMLFGSTASYPSLHEFALTAPGVKAGKKYVIYFRKTLVNRPKVSWSANLLRSALVRMEVKKCLTEGCTLWLRQGVVKAKTKATTNKKINEAAKFIKSNFDYAFSKQVWRKIGRNIW